MKIVNLRTALSQFAGQNVRAVGTIKHIAKHKGTILL